MIALADIRAALADAVTTDGFTTYRHSGAVNPPAIVVGFPGGELTTMDGAAELQWPLIVAVGASLEVNQDPLDRMCYGPESLLDRLDNIAF